MRISIIVPTINRTSPYLLNCIESIQKNSKEYHDIIIVSNWGEYYDIPHNNSSYIKRFHLKEQGQCIAMNHGVKQSITKWNMIIDDDMEFAPGWEKIFDKLEEPDMDGKERQWLFGQLMEPGRRGSSFVIEDCGDNLEEFDREKYHTAAVEKAQDKIVKGFGFPLFFQKKAWKEVEGYDESYDPWGSNCDSDLEYKIMLAGYSMEQYLGSLFYHFQQKSGTFTDPEAEACWTRNTNYFPRKWGCGRMNQPRIWSTEFIIPADELIYKPSWAKFEDNPHIQPDASYNEATECPTCRYNYLNFRNPNGCPQCLAR